MVQGNRVTIDDIARHANVSKATVSRVLNNSAAVTESRRLAVLEAMGQLDFQPSSMARALAGGRSMTIGILTQNLGTPAYDAIVRGIIKGLEGTGYSPIFVDGLFKKETEHQSIGTLLGRQVDGLILVGGDLPVEDLEGLRKRVPTVVVARKLEDSRLEDWGGQCLFVDNFDIGYLATNHLIDAGHRKIGHVKGIETHEDAIFRYQGFCQAMSDAGLEVDPDLVYQGNFYGQSGILAIESWLMRGKNFTAVFAANDLCAFGVRLALYRRNIRVPDEVSIIGVDDQLEAALMAPPLTTIRQPSHEMGSAAAESILKLIEGNVPPIKPFFGKLQNRESVAMHR
ncbi:HTH-type transcriptional regulator GalR [Rubripirellula tenax]|uniref:HTH-type transcriptional regulator GalR n=1 Tax=Rubripirellula tenax TaxID=2528015 RepID=A0A5C6EG70_9BACT|nr:LacI family DNA-binding transcriptional regulator [Rubripirellula tenax]TWU48803.1 HTH-type transcriptional regulator GalR [Rubripirellula tenax]